MTAQFWIEIYNFIMNWYWIPVALGFTFVLTTILIENRNPTKTIAWLMIIVFLPVIGIIIYFFFGQKFKKIRKFTKTEKNERKLLTKIWDEKNIEIVEPTLTIRSAWKEEYEEQLQTLLEKI